MPNIYLERYAYPKSYISNIATADVDTIIVLPCHHEPELLVALESIEACDLPGGPVAVIVVINAGANSDPEVKRHNEQTLHEALEWQAQGSKKFPYYFIMDNELPPKHAGVGLARKIGMDEAVRLFEAQHKDGVILCFDADSSCEPNLLVAVEDLFQTHPKTPGCSIHFEHPLSGPLPHEVYEGILNYELHLRYYVNGLQYAGFPYAYQTIGSSMAVRSSVYQKQGGMNRRKAGEDFYFLHKIIPLGHFRNLSNTRIIPSARRSDRVPFGTGRAIGIWLDEGKEEMRSYDPRIFEELRVFLTAVDGLYRSTAFEMDWQQWPESVRSFIALDELERKLQEFNTQANSLKTFQKRFYQWFDGFRALKFVHYARDSHYGNVGLDDGLNWLFKQLGYESCSWTLQEKLTTLRRLDKASGS